MMHITPIVIPPMTDPMGRYWEQPALDEISFSLLFAWMTKETFDKLATYQVTQPTGVYPGKMWKMQATIKSGKNTKRAEWVLCYFDHCDQLSRRGEEMCSTKWIIIRFEP